MGSKERRRAIEWGKNLLILLLSFSALYLMGRSNLGASLGEVLWKGESRMDASHSQQSGREDQQVWPVRMAVQNEKGRYGVQYDEDGIEALFSGQLGTMLGELLGMTQGLSEVPETLWREVLQSDQTWVYYDFVGSVPLSLLSGWLSEEGGQANQNLTGQVRSLLLTEVEGQKVLYCYSETKALYYRCEVEQSLSEGGGRLLSAVSQYLPNQMIFAMEDPNAYGNLWPYALIFPESPTLPAYEASNPLEDLEQEKEQLLLDLSFLPQVSTEYLSGDDLVIREGEDTLRILKNGTITFAAHSADRSQARYPVENWTANQAVDQAVEESKRLLEAVLTARIGDARSFCISGDQLDDGRIRVTFGYILSGAQVLVGNTGWAAEFYLQDGYVESFTICLRRYEELDSNGVITPETQSLYALEAKIEQTLAELEKESCELLLCYEDSGDGTITANWFAH